LERRGSLNAGTYDSVLELRSAGRKSPAERGPDTQQFIDTLSQIDQGVGAIHEAKMDMPGKNNRSSNRNCAINQNRWPTADFNLYDDAGTQSAMMKRLPMCDHNEEKIKWQLRAVKNTGGRRRAASSRKLQKNAKWQWSPRFSFMLGLFNLP